MEIVHCNFCFSHPDPQNNKFFLTSCGHMLCGGCSNEPAAKCKVCKQTCRFIQLSKEMPEDLKFYFSDLDKETRKLLKILYFQLRNCKIFIQEYVSQMDNKYSALKNAYKEQVLKFESSRNEIAAIETKNRLLQTEVNELKRQLNSLKESSVSQYGVVNGSADLMTPHFYSSRLGTSGMEAMHQSPRRSNMCFTPTQVTHRQYMPNASQSSMDNFLSSPANANSSSWSYQPPNARTQFYSKKYF